MRSLHQKKKKLVVVLMKLRHNHLRDIITKLFWFGVNEWVFFTEELSFKVVEAEVQLWLLPQLTSAFTLHHRREFGSADLNVALSTLSCSGQGLAACVLSMRPHAPDYNWLIRSAAVSRGVCIRQEWIEWWDEVGRLCSNKCLRWCLMLWNYCNDYDDDNGF